MSVELVRTLIQSVLGWPVAAVVIGFLFRRPITNLVDRILSIRFNKEGLMFEATPSNQQIASKGEKPLDTVSIADADSSSEARLLESDNPLVQQREESIRQDLKKIQLDSNKTIELLINRLAITELFFLAERLYRLIYGSQLFILKLLNTSGPQPTSVLLSVYEHAKAQWPDFYAKYSADQYLNFMVGHDLIAASAGTYSITEAGKEFLKWMAEVGLSDQKPF